MKNIHVTLTHFLNESRALKEINSLLEAGIVTEVIVIALWKSGLKKTENIGDNIKVIRIDLNPIYLINLVFKISEISRDKLLIAMINYHLFFLKPDIVNIHHVNALGVVRLKRILRKCLFIYDAHELETETLSSVGEIKKVRQRLEQKFIPRVDHTFVVSPSIENWYRNTYKMDKISTVMNTPLKHRNVVKKDIFRKKYKLKNQDTLFIYNGALFDGRGIKILLEVFEKITDKSNHIVFMGDGELESLILEYEKRNENIHFQEAVAPSQVIEYTACADVGLSLGENVCLSYYYSLPNKIFEYTIAEIPMIVADMEDMKNYVINNELGVVAKSYAVEDVTQSVITIARDKTLYKDALLRAKELYNWENEEEKMIGVYRNLLSH